VTDPQGAVIPGVQIVITNTETNTISRLTSNETGYFEANFLNPGSYSLTAEVTGFKKVVRGGLELQVAGRLDLPIQMEIGATAEVVEVTAEAPLLDTTTASGGRVIDSRQITQLPISDLNPFALASVAPGMYSTDQPEYVRPFDNGGTSGFRTMGGTGGSNEYTLDGAPVAGTGRRVGFNPPADAVGEFRLETSNFDASNGFTSGATVNVSSRGGTNSLHGSIFDQHWQQRWNATPHFTRLAYDAGVASGKIKPGTQKQASGRSNNFGGSVSGPVYIPKIFNGKDKVFFSFVYNGIKQAKAETTSSINRSVPKMSWRQGDFSDLLAIDPARYTVYDPRSARQEGSRVVRQPFPGNKGVPILNPMYGFYSKIYPVPNDIPGLVNAEGANNYYAAQMPKNENFYSHVERIDYNVSENHRINGRYFYNHRLADEYDWTYETMRGLHRNGLVRQNQGGGGDWTWTLNSSNILNLGVSWMRFSEGSDSPTRTQFKPSDVGLPKYMDDKAGDYTSLPRLDFDSIEDVSDSYPVVGTLGSTADASLRMTTIKGNHSFRYGYTYRRYQYSGLGAGNSSGIFQFRRDYMRSTDADNNAAHRGLEWAAFMMGMPNRIGIDTNDSAYAWTPYQAAYFQDDLRITNKLRLNLGLRFERNGGTRERYNRAIGGGFDPSVAYAFAEDVRTQYAKAPIPELAPQDLKIMGGNTYMGLPSETWTEPFNMLMPKAALVYQLNSKTVLRTGYGWWYDGSYNVNNDRPAQDGYNLETVTQTTTDNGLTFCCGVGSVSDLGQGRTLLTDPFPTVRSGGARFDMPYGNTLGSYIRVGRGFTFRPSDFRPPKQQRFRVSIQRELSKDMVLDVSYNFSYARFYVEERVDYLPEQYWANGMSRRQDIDDWLNTNLTNPFRLSALPGVQAKMDPKVYSWLINQGFFNSSNVRRHTLLRGPYLHMNDLKGFNPDREYENKGKTIYNDFQVQLDKRFSRGLNFQFSYTWANGRDADWYKNQFEQTPTWRPSNNARGHRFVNTGIYEMPFGKGRTWVTENPVQHIVGGWNVGWIYSFQSGPYTGDWNNEFFYGDMNQLLDVMDAGNTQDKDIHQWFNPNIVYKGSGAVPANFVGFEGRTNMRPGEYHMRMLPQRFTGLRADGINKWDLKVERQFRISEQVRTRFSVDLLNAFNHTSFSGPSLDPTSTNFGKVTSQRGPSRIIQLNLRVEF
jgi:hypothetical protein